MKLLRVNNNFILINSLNADIYITKSETSYLIEFYKFSESSLKIEKSNYIFGTIYNLLTRLPNERNNTVILIPEFHNRSNLDKAFFHSLNITYDEWCIIFGVNKPYYSFYIDDGRFSRMNPTEYIKLFDNLFVDLLNKSILLSNYDYISKDSELLEKMDRVSNELKIFGYGNPNKDDMILTLTNKYIAGKK